MKVIFLDVDGVLINRKACREAYEEKRQPQAWPECMMELNRIVKETGANVVMSSCWRIGRSLIEIKDLLHGWKFVGTLIGRTPYLKGVSGQGNGVAVKRGHEIQAWLDEYNNENWRHGEVERFVIIDDDSDMEHLTEHLVKCNFNTGLTTSKAALAIQRLTV